MKKMQFYNCGGGMTLLEFYWIISLAIGLYISFKASIHSAVGNRSDNPGVYEVVLKGNAVMVVVRTLHCWRKKI